MTEQEREEARRHSKTSAARFTNLLRRLDPSFPELDMSEGVTGSGRFYVRLNLLPGDLDAHLDAAEARLSDAGVAGSADPICAECLTERSHVAHSNPGLYNHHEYLPAGEVAGTAVHEVGLLEFYSAALDEIYALRTVLAAQADIVEAHLSLRSFPKSRRQVAEEQVEGMRQAARGAWRSVYATIRRPKNVLAHAGASETLTRWEWERQRLAGSGDGSRA